MSEDPAGPLDLHSGARLIGAYCAVERRLFEVAGAGSTRPDAPPEAAIFLSALSAEHAWHAELWADRLPVLGTIDPSTLVAIPNEVGPVLSGLDEAPPLELLVGLCRVVLPRLVADYTRHQRCASAVSEAPTKRALRLVLYEETEAWAGGEALVQGLLDSPEAVRRAATAVAELEVQLVQAGLGRGLVPWPGRRA